MTVSKSCQQLCCRHEVNGWEGSSRAGVLPRGYDKRKKGRVAEGIHIVAFRTNQAAEAGQGGKGKGWRRPGVGCGAPGIQSFTETKEWAAGSLNCRAGRMGRGAGNPDLRARGMRGPRYNYGKGLPGPQRREGYGAT